MPEQTDEPKQQPDDGPLGVPGVPPSEFHPQRPDAPFKKRGNLKTALLVGAGIILLDLFIYFFLLKPDDTQLLKAIEPLKPPTPTAAQPIVSPTTQVLLPSQAAKPTLAEVTKLAKEDLAKRLTIDPSQIKTESEEFITWNDGSMGCPQPEMMYSMALVEGSKVVLSAQKKTYDYHAGTNGKPFLCEKPAK